MVTKVNISFKHYTHVVTIQLLRLKWHHQILMRTQKVCFMVILKV